MAQREHSTALLAEFVRRNLNIRFSLRGNALAGAALRSGIVRAPR